MKDLFEYSFSYGGDSCAYLSRRKSTTLMKLGISISEAVDDRGSCSAAKFIILKWTVLIFNWHGI